MDISKFISFRFKFFRLRFVSVFRHFFVSVSVSVNVNHTANNPSLTDIWNKLNSLNWCVTTTVNHSYKLTSKYKERNITVVTTHLQPNHGPCRGSTHHKAQSLALWHPLLPYGYSYKASCVGMWRIPNPIPNPTEYDSFSEIRNPTDT